MDVPSPNEFGECTFKTCFERVLKLDALIILMMILFVGVVVIMINLSYQKMLKLQLYHLKLMNQLIQMLIIY